MHRLILESIAANVTRFARLGDLCSSGEHTAHEQRIRCKHDCRTHRTLLSNDNSWRERIACNHPTAQLLLRYAEPQVDVRTNVVQAVHPTNKDACIQRDRLRRPLQQRKRPVGRRCLCMARPLRPAGATRADTVGLLMHVHVCVCMCACACACYGCGAYMNQEKRRLRTYAVAMPRRSDCFHSFRFCRLQACRRCSNGWSARRKEHTRSCACERAVTTLMNASRRFGGEDSGHSLKRVL